MNCSIVASTIKYIVLKTCHLNAMPVPRKRSSVLLKARSHGGFCPSCRTTQLLALKRVVVNTVAWPSTQIELAPSVSSICHYSYRGHSIPVQTATRSCIHDLHDLLYTGVTIYQLLLRNMGEYVQD